MSDCWRACGSGRRYSPARGASSHPARRPGPVHGQPSRPSLHRRRSAEADARDGTVSLRVRTLAQALAACGTPQPADRHDARIGRRDRIIRNTPTTAWLRRVAAQAPRVHEFPDAAHTLEFESDVASFGDVLRHWALAHCPSRRDRVPCAPREQADAIQEFAMRRPCILALTGSFLLVTAAQPQTHRSADAQETGRGRVSRREDHG